MMGVKGKKIAGFLALPHHTRFFMPMRDEITKQKGDILFITPLSDYPYELDMIKRKLTYRHFTDYMVGDVVDKINASLSELFDRWAAICFKWKGFGRWPLFKETWLLRETLTEYFCMEQFLKVEKPDMFLAHHECGRWGKIIGRLCFKYKIPFVTFQEGDYYVSQVGNALHTEYSTANLLWGNVTKERLAACKNSADKMFPTGNTHIDGAITEYSRPEVMAATRKELGLPRDKKIVLFLVGVTYGPITDKNFWEAWLKPLVGMEEAPIFIFKWHPLVYKSALDKIKDIMKELYPSVIILDKYDPYKLIAISDYCVTLGQTTLAIEALAFGKPLFSVPDAGMTDDYYLHIGISQTVFPLGDWTNLISAVASGIPAEKKTHISKFLADNFYKLDGKSVERAIDVMSYILDVREATEKHTGRKPEQNKIQNKFTAGKISFIIPSGKDSEALLATLTSLSQNVKHRDWEVVIVVNDSGVKEALSAISGGVSIIAAEGNLAHLYNTGAEISSGEYLVFMRPGIVYFKDEGIAGSMDGGIAGIAIKNIDMTPYCLGIGFDFNCTPYFIREDLTLNSEGTSAEPASGPTLNGQRDAVGGGLIGMHRSIFESVRKFDDGIANHLIEPDICLKAKELNVPIRYLPDCLAFNYKETFFGEDVSDENWKNRVKFFAKWVGELPKNDDFLLHAGDLLKV